MQEVFGLAVGSRTHRSRTRTMQASGASSVPVTWWPLTGETTRVLLGRVDVACWAYGGIPYGSNRPTITRIGTVDRRGVATAGSPRPASHTRQASRSGLCP